jgi:fatty-acyl-CoA synthase
VLHTVNVRLFEDQIVYVISHAEDVAVLVDHSLVPVLEKLAPRLESVRHYVVMGDGDHGTLPNAVAYAALTAKTRVFVAPRFTPRVDAGISASRTAITTRPSCPRTSSASARSRRSAVVAARGRSVVARKPDSVRL